MITRILFRLYSIKSENNECHSGNISFELEHSNGHLVPMCFGGFYKNPHRKTSFLTIVTDFSDNKKLGKIQASFPLLKDERWSFAISDFSQCW